MEPLVRFFPMAPLRDSNTSVGVCCIFYPSCNFTKTNISLPFFRRKVILSLPCIPFSRIAFVSRIYFIRQRYQFACNKTLNNSTSSSIYSRDCWIMKAGLHVHLGERDFHRRIHLYPNPNPLKTHRHFGCEAQIR